MPSPGLVLQCSGQGPEAPSRGFFVAKTRRFQLKYLMIFMATGMLQGCTLLAIADAAGSAVVYSVKTTVNVIDAVTPDIVNRKKD